MSADNKKDAKFKTWWISHWKRVCSWVGIVLLALVGLVLVFNQPIASWMVANQSQKVSAPTGKASYNYGQVKSLSSADVMRARLKHHNFIGAIAMPKIGMSTPIVEGVAPDDLAVGAGTMRPHMKMGRGNYALAGHNMDTTNPVLFSPIFQEYSRGANRMLGDKIYVSDLKKIYVYQVTNVREISPHDVSVVNNTPESMITLITCNYTGSERIMVRGIHTKTMPFNHASAHVRAMLTQNVKK